MWAYADPRDVADAHVLALEADLKGHEPFLLAQPTTRFREPTTELIKQNFGNRVEIRGGLRRQRKCHQYGKGATDARFQTETRLEHIYRGIAR